MTLLFIDSFDHYTTVAQKYEDAQFVSIAAGTGRNGTNALVLTSGTGSAVAFKTVPTYDTFILGCGFYAVNDCRRGFGVADSGTRQITIVRNAAGLLEARRGVIGGGAIVATGTTPLLTGQYYYLEAYIIVHNSLGQIITRVNGIEDINASGLDTQESGNASANQVGFSSADGSAGTIYFDDFYACDDQGSQNNAFLGDHRVEAIYPSGIGNSADWTPVGAANNWDCADENPPDGDTTYVSKDGSALPALDTYEMTDLITVVGNIAGVQTLLLARKDDAGVVTCEPTFRIGGVDYPQSSVNLPDTYGFLPEIVEDSPATLSSFTIAEINGLEFGAQRSA